MTQGIRPSRDYGDLWGYLAPRICLALQDLREASSRIAARKKPDGSPITGADVSLQCLIAEALRRFEPDAAIIAEEGWRGPPPDMTRVVWTVDSIDGTRQFISREGFEYCTAIAVLEEGMPVACLIVAPHLGVGRTPVIVAVDGWPLTPTVNGKPATATRVRGDAPLHASVTGQSAVSKRLIPFIAADRIIVKRRATSLTLDMVRTCIDICDLTGLCTFDWFYRASQKIWDAGPGIALARASSMAAVNSSGDDLWPVLPKRLHEPQLTFPSVLIAQPSATDSILALLGDGDGVR
jgi:3'(2'), 5'-bisphosphate nucleotidase